MWSVKIDRNILGRTVKVYVLNEDPSTGRANVLQQDGTWFTTQADISSVPNAGFELPMECLRELQVALGEFLGDRGDKELRADLQREKDRVDSLFRALLGSVSTDPALKPLKIGTPMTGSAGSIGGSSGSFTINAPTGTP